MALIFLNICKCVHVHKCAYTLLVTYQLQPVISADIMEVFIAWILEEKFVIHLDKCSYRLRTSEIKSSTRGLVFFLARFRGIQIYPVLSPWGQLTLGGRGSISLMVNRFATGLVYIQSLCDPDKI